MTLNFLVADRENSCIMT